VLASQALSEVNEQSDTKPLPALHVNAGGGGGGDGGGGEGDDGGGGGGGGGGDGGGGGSGARLMTMSSMKTAEQSAEAASTMTWSSELVFPVPW
jgi:hypothetical protein